MDAETMLADLQNVRVKQFKDQKKKVEDVLNPWFHGTPPTVDLPRAAGPDHIKIAQMSRDPWLRHGINTIAQGLKVERFSQLDGSAHPVWNVWNESQMGLKERVLYETTLAFGHAYEVAELSDSSPSGYTISVYSPSQMITWYSDPINDTKPALALRFEKGIFGEEYYHRYDDEQIITYVKNEEGWKVYDVQPHGFDEIPVQRFINVLNPLSGTPVGEIEPNINAAKRINKSTYDLMLTQHFNSWKVRVISGLDPAEDEYQLDAEGRVMKDPVTNQPIILRTAQQIERDRLVPLKQGDFLALQASEDRNGNAVIPSVSTLPETSLDGFIRAKDQSVKALAALMQASSPALLGDLSNLSAESLIVAETEQRRKIEARQASWGSSHERILRLIARAMNVEITGKERITWRTVDHASISAVVDALVKLKTIGIPDEALWAMVPNSHPEDLDNWKRMREDGDLQGQIIRAQLNSETSNGGIVDTGE